MLIPSLDGRQHDSNYNTWTTPSEELKYQEFVKNTLSKIFGTTDENSITHDYDMRGFFLDPTAEMGPNPIDGKIHFMDKYKKPNHLTFSEESKYAYDNPLDAGSWNDQTYNPTNPKKMADYIMYQLYNQYKPIGGQ